MDLTPGLPLTTRGLTFDVALDHIYHEGYLYSLHVSYDYEEEAIVRTDLKSRQNQVIYQKRSKDYGDTFVLMNINRSNQLELYGALCNIYDASIHKICSFKIQL